MLVILFINSLEDLSIIMTLDRQNINVKKYIFHENKALILLKLSLT